MMITEDIELYMRLSGDQMRYWICVSLDKNCAHCEGSNTELVGVGQFGLYLCRGCIVLLRLPRYMLLREKLSPEAYRNIDSRLVPHQLCEECGRIESAWCMFSLGPGDGKCNFICGRCAYRWTNEDEVALPNIMATTYPVIQ
jgi:hypothetical protein